MLVICSKEGLVDPTCLLHHYMSTSGRVTAINPEYFHGRTLNYRGGTTRNVEDDCGAVESSSVLIVTVGGGLRRLRLLYDPT